MAWIEDETREHTLTLPAELHVVWESDDCPDLSHLGDWTDNPDAHTIARNPGHVGRGQYKQFRPTYTLADRARDLRGRCGYARGPAWEEANRQVREDMRRMETYGDHWSYMVLTVTLKCHGIEVDACLGGIESDGGAEYAESLVSDLVAECEAELAERLDKLSAVLV